MLHDLLVVGAGLTGLTLVHRLRQSRPNWSIKIIDKGISAGGRLASRRLGTDTFDHGVQYIPDHTLAQEFIGFWQSQFEAVVSNEDPHEGCFSALGMTALAKSLAKDLDVEFRHKVVSLSEATGNWSVLLDSGQEYLAKSVVLTCPLPQSLDVLDQSKIAFPSDLRERSYRKTIVLMIQTGEGAEGLELTREDIQEFAIGAYPQHKKRPLSIPGWSIEMNASWSEAHFDLPDSQILELVLKRLREKNQRLRVVSSSIKKWRFATPESAQASQDVPFFMPRDRLFLGGDTFGLTGVLGAFQSSNRLAKLLSSESL